MTVRTVVLVAAAGAVTAAAGGINARVSAQRSPASLVGAWTLNAELSDHADEGSGDGRDSSGERGARRGGGGGRGGFGVRGGRGGGGRRGGGAPGAVDPDQTARARDAVRDIMNPPAHLIIVQTESMIVVTGPDGRTIRLSPDGKKIKDEATKLDRKTKWDGEKLVSEITGLAGAKITEAYSADPERHQLHVVVVYENDRRPRTVNRVYDADQLR